MKGGLEGAKGDSGQEMEERVREARQVGPPQAKTSAICQLLHPQVT